MDKKISIIGVNGKMGKWFANYFHKMGFEVVGFDTNNEIKEKFIIKAHSLISAILKMDYVLLCTPTKNTPETPADFLNVTSLTSSSLLNSTPEGTLYTYLSVA